MAANTFYRYMLQFLEEDTPRGDLARDMQYEQERSPWNTRDLNEYTSWEKLRNYLEFHRACDECIQTAKTCWQEYRKTRTAPDNR